MRQERCGKGRQWDLWFRLLVLALPGGLGAIALRILGEEHDDCSNWARWVWDLQLGRGYPKRWPIPNGIDEGLIERDRLFDELDALEAKSYDERRACTTDLLFRIWLDHCRIRGQCWGKRHFMNLRAAYLLHRDIGELAVRESLRALADLKANNPLAKRRSLSYCAIPWAPLALKKCESAA